MTDATYHSPLSPSARHRWGACPGSVREEAKYPEQASGGAAVDGTHSHTLLEYAIKNGAMLIPDTFIGMEFEDHEGKFTLAKDRIDRVNNALVYIRNRMEQNGTTPIAEKRVHPDGLVGRADMSGTVDVQIPGKAIYEIIDYKDGMHPVSAVQNPQLIQYAVGVLAGIEQKAWPVSFNLTIAQPRLASKGVPTISSWNISTKGLLVEAEKMKAQADATDDPDAPLVPGEAQCKYCRAKGACPAFAKQAMEAIGMMFTPAEVVPDGAIDVASQAAQKDPTQMGSDELRQIMEGAPLMRQLLDGVEKEVLRRLNAGEVVPGFKLVRGRGSKGWALPQEDMEKKLASLKIPKASMYPKKILSPAAIKDLTWEKDGETCKLSPDQLKRIESEWVAYSEGKITVAPEADSRPAITTDASAMFAPIEVKAEPVTPPVTTPPWLQAAPVVATVTPPWLV